MIGEQIGDATLYQGDASAVLAALPEGSIQTCITSPPYFGLRNYLDAAGQIGLEQTPEQYVAALVGVFRAVRRVLHDAGTVWLNLGDTYYGSSMTGGTSSLERGKREHRMFTLAARPQVPGLKTKDLIGIPWMVAFALRADGWYLRSDIIWHKPNPMPESVRDRPTKAHEYVFLLSKGPSYHYDADAIKEPVAAPRKEGPNAFRGQAALRARGKPTVALRGYHPEAVSRNKRSVWSIATRPFSAKRLGITDVDHFAAYPPDLVRPCVLAGAPPDSIVLDPFCGSGTTGVVALEEGRAFVGVDLNADYLRIARARIQQAHTALTEDAA